MDVNWIGLVVLSRAHTKGPPSYGGVCKGYPSYDHQYDGCAEGLFKDMK
jgi:hypothetical protein